VDPADEDPSDHEVLSRVNDTDGAGLVPGWVTVRVAVSIGATVVVYVSVPVRASVPGLYVARTYADDPPEPGTSDDDNHGWDDVTFQADQDDTATNMPAEAFDPTSHSLMSNVSDILGCDTDTVFVTTVDPEVVVTVTVAARATLSLFAAALSVTLPSPDPVAGVAVSHAWFEEIFQFAFDDTCTRTLAADDEGTVHAAMSTLNATAAPGCDTDTVFVCTTEPAVVNVTVAARDEVLAFGLADRVTVAFPVPVPGDTVTQV